MLASTVMVDVVNRRHYQIPIPAGIVHFITKVRNVHRTTLATQHAYDEDGSAFCFRVWTAVIYLRYVVSTLSWTVHHRKRVLSPRVLKHAAESAL